MRRVGRFIFRYGLALIFLWAGFLKLFAYEAKNIEPMVTNSPIWSWAIRSLGLQGLSNVIGVIEILIGLGPFLAKDLVLLRGVAMDPR